MAPSTALTMRSTSAGGVRAVLAGVVILICGTHESQAVGCARWGCGHAEHTTLFFDHGLIVCSMVLEECDAL